MPWLLILLAVVAGAAVPVQTAVNARLGLGVGHPLLAALVSFLVGSAALGLFTVLLRVPLPTSGRLAALPPATWVGGLLGAFYIVTNVLLAPRLGTAVLLGLVIVGQLVTALVIDHFGLLGLSVHPVSVGRVAGLLLVVAGVLLFRRF